MEMEMEMEMEATHHQPLQIQKPTTPTLHIRRTHKKSQMGSHSLKPHSIRKREKKQIKRQQVMNKEEGVEDKIMALQRIVPGGEALGSDTDKLFQETADYILALQSQVMALRALSALFQDLDKEKRKLGA